MKNTQFFILKTNFCAVVLLVAFAVARSVEAADIALLGGTMVVTGQNAEFWYHKGDSPVELASIQPGTEIQVERVRDERHFFTWRGRAAYIKKQFITPLKTFEDENNKRPEPERFVRSTVDGVTRWIAPEKGSSPATKELPPGAIKCEVVRSMSGGIAPGPTGWRLNLKMGANSGAAMKGQFLNIVIRKPVGMSPDQVNPSSFLVRDKRGTVITPDSVVTSTFRRNDGKLEDWEKFFELASTEMLLVFTTELSQDDLTIWWLSAEAVEGAPRKN